MVVRVCVCVYVFGVWVYVVENMRVSGCVSEYVYGFGAFVRIWKWCILGVRVGL